MIATLVLAACLVNPVYFHGVVGAVKTDSPYPLKTTCGTVWKCKVKIIVTDYEGDVNSYKAYPTGDGSQCWIGNDVRFDCCKLKRGMKVRGQFASKPASPFRGEIMWLEVIE